MRLFYLFSSKSRQIELRQHLFPVLVGPSEKTCPKRDPHTAQLISILCIPLDSSTDSFTLPGIASSNEGQPVPESNLASELKSLCPQTLQVYTPSLLSCKSLPEKGASVLFCLKTAYSSGVNFFFIFSSSIFF